MKPTALLAFATTLAVNLPVHAATTVTVTQDRYFDANFVKTETCGITRVTVIGATTATRTTQSGGKTTSSYATIMVSYTPTYVEGCAARDELYDAITLESPNLQVASNQGWVTLSGSGVSDFDGLTKYDVNFQLTAVSSPRTETGHSVEEYGDVIARSNGTYTVRDANAIGTLTSNGETFLSNDITSSDARIAKLLNATIEITTPR